MANQNKFEAMLEKLIAEDKAGAEELFHEIVVEKSRDIYENLLKDDVEEVEVDEATDEEVDETTDEEVDESSDDEETNESTDEEVDETTDEEVDEATDEEVDEASDEEVDENFVDEITPEAEDDMGGDAADDMMADIAADGEEGDESDDEDIEDRVTDLEDTFDDLKAEFDAMMSDKDGDEGEGDAEPEMDMDAGDDEGDDEAEEAFAPEADLEVAPAFEGKKDANTEMREYVEKVTANMGDNGANTKSPVAGKNDMGGTTANIAKGSSEEKGGKASGPKEDNAGNVNVPGGKASKSMSANSKGHGAEKKGAGESGTDSKSTIGS